MSLVVPSQVCAFIDQEFNYIPVSDRKPDLQRLVLTDNVCASLRGLIALIERVPAGLLPTHHGAFNAVVSSVESIKHHLTRTENLEAMERGSIGELVLPPGMASGGWSPVIVIRNAFSECPDDITPIDSKDFLFIKDANIRADLLADLTSTRSALMSSEWKPSTVIAGSLAEALLLWAVDKHLPADVAAAAARAVSSGALKQRPPTDPEKWGLEQYIEICQELQILAPDTRAQLDIVREFRNLIHPGRARRTLKRCDRGTALAANAGVELLSRDLAKRFP